MEFRSCYQGQVDPFLVQVHLYTKMYVVRKIERLLRDFREWQSNRRSSQENGNDDEDADADDGAAAVSEEETTKLVVMMTDLFSFRFECSDEDATERFLKASDDTKVLQCVGDWLDIIYRTLRGNDPMRTKIERGCATADMVARFIAPFISKSPEHLGEGSDVKCCPYPLIEKVVIALSNPVLDRGNIVTDAPGIGDTNKAHVDRAHLALKNADKIMVVCNIGRIVDNEDTYTNLDFAAGRRGLRCVILVLTHSAVSVPI